MNKFKIKLTWHNCLIYPPSEFENNSLIVTNGKDVYGMSWYKPEGYFIAIGDDCFQLNYSKLSEWWWADVEQTVQGDERFNGVNL